MERYEQIVGILNKFNVIVESMKHGLISLETMGSVMVMVKRINSCLYHVETLKFQREYQCNEYDECVLYVEELTKLMNIWKHTISLRSSNKVDAQFWEIYEFFKYVAEEDIYQMVVSQFLSLPLELQEVFRTLRYSYPFLQKEIDYTQQDYSLIKQHVDLLVNNIEKFKWFYESLGDYRSKAILNGIIRYWFDFDTEHLHSLRETVFSEYFDLDILECDKDAVLVDLGAFTGDSAFSFVDNYKEFKRIYAYEITPSTYDLLCQNVMGDDRIIPCKKGVADVAGRMYVRGCEYGAGNRLSQEGDVEIQVVTLDDDIQEPISVIKMDIEGAEKRAIVGARRHIQTEKPALLVSAYHLPEDIIEIPELVASMRDDYKFYLRYNGGDTIWPCDYVVYAV